MIGTCPDPPRSAATARNHRSQLAIRSCRHVRARSGAFRHVQRQFGSSTEYLFWTSSQIAVFGELTVIPLCEHVFVYKTDQSSFGGEPTTRHPWPAIHVPIADPTGWAASEIHAGLRALERIRRETEAATAVLIAALPETRDSVTSLARETGISTREARRRRDIAAVAGAVPGALALLGSGIVSGEHVAALMPAIGKAGVGELAASAVGTRPEDFARAVEQFRLAGEHGEDTARRQRALRRLRFFKGPEGMVGINGLLAPIHGATLRSVLAAIMDARYRAEHPERAAVLGGHGGDTYEQRMADALLEIAGITPSPQAKPAAPTDGTPVTAAARAVTAGAVVTTLSHLATKPLANPLPLPPLCRCRHRRRS